MGFENARRWPAFILLSICLLLTVSLFNSWTNEAQLRSKFDELGVQSQECAKKQSSCIQEKESLEEEKDSYFSRLSELTREKDSLKRNLDEEKSKVVQKETQQNHTKLELGICETELQSLKDLQMTKSATLESMRLEKETLNSELASRKSKILELEDEIDKLKVELSKANQPLPNKATPAPPKPQLSKVLESPNDNAENNAQEVIEEPLNDNNPIPLDD